MLVLGVRIKRLIKIKSQHPVMNILHSCPIFATLYRNDVQHIIYADRLVMQYI